MSGVLSMLLVLAVAAGPLSHRPTLRPHAGHAQGPAASGSVTLERRLVLMGTEASVRVSAESREAALAGAEAAVRALEGTEQRLSTWTDESELARVNWAPSGERVDLSPELAAELAAAVECSRATGGAFDPAVGSLVEAWGLRKGGRVPGASELETARRASGADGLALEGRDGAAAVRRTPGLRIEEGGFGKGAALDAAVAALAESPGVASAVLNLGGQVAAYAPGEVAEPSSTRPPAGVEVEVAHPDRRDLPVAAVRLASGSVATSGNSERGLTVNGERLSHILDPRTGRPAPDFGSLTVVAPTALEADCLSTGLYVLGPEAEVAWAAERPGVEVLALRRSGAPSGGSTGAGDAAALGLLATPGLAGRVIAEEIVQTDFGLDQPPARATAAGTKGGAGAEDSVASGRTAPRSRQDRGRRGRARRPHDPQGEYICPLHSSTS